MVGVEQISGAKIMVKNIVLADDQGVFRAGMARTLTAEHDLRIVGQCDDLDRLYKAAETLRGSIVVVASSLEPALPRLHQKVSSAASRLIAVLEKSETPCMFLKHNVMGIIYRDVSQTEIIKCVRTVACGGSYVQQRSGTSSISFDSDVIGARVRNRLSPKELQILGLIVQGYKNKDIAQELNNSEQVIKNYLRSIFDKTGVSARLELALFAIHHRVLSEPADATLAIGHPVLTMSQAHMPEWHSSNQLGGLRSGEDSRAQLLVPTMH